MTNHVHVNACVIVQFAQMHLCLQLLYSYIYKLIKMVNFIIQIIAELFLTKLQLVYNCMECLLQFMAQLLL